MMYCDKCNAEFPDSMTYCKWCGGTLRAKAVATTQLRKCYSCASPMQPGWEFCNVCGARQTPAVIQEPVSISPLCMRCGAVVPPGVTNCLRCGERFTPEHRSEAASQVIAPSVPESRCPACGDALQKGALYCKTCGSPAPSGTMDLQVPTAPVQPGPPSQPAPPIASPDAESTIDFSAMRPTEPPAIITHPESTIDLAGLRQQSVSPPPPPPNFGQTEIIHSPQDRTPPEGTMAFKSGRSTDESSGQKTLLSNESSKSGVLETRVEQPGLQNVTPPDFTTVSKREELPAATHDPQGIHLTPTINLNEELAPPPTAPPPQLGSSTIQIGSGDWLSESFAKEPPSAPPQPPPAPDTFFDTSQNTVINRGESQTPGQPAEWQQAPTIETSSFKPPVTQAPGGETMPPMPPVQHSATPPYGQTAPPQPMPPSPFPPPVKTKKGGLPILPIAAVVVGLGIVAFLLYWFVLRAKPTNTNANISQQTNANSSVANANTTVANSNTSTTQTTTAAPDGMVLIAAGTYPIGREDGDDIEKPKHDVTLKAFYMDKTEVTNADYKKFILATSHQAPSDWQNGSFPAGKDNFPVVNVTWKDANDYAAWAKKRLPTEEEWEAAARGTDGRKYPWGNSFNPSNANIQSKGIVEVGKFPDGKSPAGALDMIGNVWEWTATKFALYSGNTDNPPEEVNKNYRVIRGGAYDGDKKHDASYRGYVEADKGLPKTGFRCVKDAS